MKAKYDALAFIQHLRETPKAPVGAIVGPAINDLDTLVEAGANLGFDFSVEEMRMAFRRDWQMRWLKHFKQ
jgi:hypothetical protein